MAKIAGTLDEISVRAIRTVVEEVHSEGGTATDRPRKIAASYAVLKNPWLNDDTASNLTDFAAFAAPVLAKEITTRLLDHLGGAAKVERSEGRLGGKGGRGGIGTATG